jgi:hypothetical protein
LAKRNFCLGVLKSAESHDIIVESNSNVILRTFVDKEVPYHSTCALLQNSARSTVNEDLDISPGMVTYNYMRNGLIEVHVSNVTARTISIPPRAILCELQPVSVADVPEDVVVREQVDDILSQMDITSDNLSKEDLQKGIDLIKKFEDIFSRSETDLGFTAAVRHRINLLDETPFKQRYRRIPSSMYSDHLHQLLASGVIRKS